MEPEAQVTVGYLLWRVVMKWRSAVDRAVSPLGLTHAQFSALASLYALSASGSLPSQRELADYAGLDPIYISRLVRALESRGMLQRAKHPDDPRAVQLTLTDHGAEIALQAAGIVWQLQEELTAPIGGTTSRQHCELARTLRALLGLPHPSGTQKQGEPMTTGPALTGQDIGEAAEAVRRLLDNAAASVGRSASEFVALRVLALRGPITPPSDLRDFLAQQRQFGLDQAGVAEVLAGLEGQGLVSGSLEDGSGPAQLTDTGRAAFGQLGAAVAATTDRLYAGMDQQDLAAARRVLAEVTERAKGLNAV